MPPVPHAGNPRQRASPSEATASIIIGAWRTSGSTIREGLLYRGGVVDVDRPQPGGRLLGVLHEPGGRIGRIHMGANLAGLIAIVSREAAAGIMHRAGGHRGPADFLHCGGKWIRTIGPPPEIVVDPSGSRRDHMKISLELKGFVRGAGSADA